MSENQPQVILPDHTPLKHRPSRGQRLRSVAATLLVLVAAPLTAFILTVYVFQTYEVDGPSMESTLQDNDRLLVLKLGRSWARFSGGTYLPRRGDIIVFNRSETASSGEHKRQLIKRVVGLPGDRVVIGDGQLTIFNSDYPAGYRPDSVLAHGVVTGPTTGNFDITVPEDEVFVMGDNRNNSLDSRTFGTVSHTDIVGRLWVRILPFNKFDAF